MKKIVNLHSKFTALSDVVAFIESVDRKCVENEEIVEMRMVREVDPQTNKPIAGFGITITTLVEC